MAWHRGGKIKQNDPISGEYVVGSLISQCAIIDCYEMNEWSRYVKLLKNTIIVMVNYIGVSFHYHPFL